ncbi:MAG: LPS export ABC transporter permease LptF [Tropicimonas sp.]|uniref:LPS export ABC transporter permease LptF n=1 Tax=Tropicimonas sp. TaxID=2067044 RepID=UPI003A88A601
MTRFDRYFTYQLTVLFGFFSLILVSIYWVNRAVVLFDQILADGQSAGTFIALTLFTLPNVMRMVLPISAFVATVYATNRLITESELVIPQAIGMSLWRLARPVAVFGLLASLLMGLFVHFLVPVSRTELAERSAAVEADVSTRLLTEGRFLHPVRGVTLYIRSIQRDGEMRDVFLSDARSPTARIDYVAARAYLVREEAGPKLVMVNGTAHSYDLATERLSATTFANFTYDISALMSAGGRGRPSVREYGTATLFNPDELALAVTGEEPARFLYEGHLRIAQPFNPLVVSLMGFAALMLGGYSRFGVWPQIGLAVGLIILLQALENATADITRRDITLWPLIYLPSLLGLLSAGTMLWIACRPALFRRPGAAEVAP